MNLFFCVQDGSTGLFLAAQNGFVKIVNVILDTDATVGNLARFPDGATPLWVRIYVLVFYFWVSFMSSAHLCRIGK